MHAQFFYLSNDFFGTIMGTFILSYVGNSVVRDLHCSSCVQEKMGPLMHYASPH